jgi:type 1 fimbria pilin
MRVAAIAAGTLAAAAVPCAHSSTVPAAGDMSGQLHGKLVRPASCSVVPGSSAAAFTTKRVQACSAASAALPGAGVMAGRLQSGRM